jgi:hypothetical protein
MKQQTLVMASGFERYSETTPRAVVGHSVDIGSPEQLLKNEMEADMPSAALFKGLLLELLGLEVGGFERYRVQSATLQLWTAAQRIADSHQGVSCRREGETPADALVPPLAAVDRSSGVDWCGQSIGLPRRADTCAWRLPSNPSVATAPPTVDIRSVRTWRPSRASAAAILHQRDHGFFLYNQVAHASPISLAALRAPI